MLLAMLLAAPSHWTPPATNGPDPVYFQIGTADALNVSVGNVTVDGGYLTAYQGGAPWSVSAQGNVTVDGGQITGGQAVCYLDTGTTPVQNYNITYVQQ
jgi:phage baseplate assembly protein gpV